MFPFLKKKTPLPKIPADKIDPDAIRVIRGLNKAKYEAYVVGGGVRDLLLGMQPKDFDIATDARPRQISRALGRNAVIIGKRFKIVLFTIPEKGKQIEIATFRKAPEYSKGGARSPSAPTDFETRPHSDKPGALYQTEDNEWGTIEDDFSRRDFTANALYYDYSRDQIVDFVGGISDISRKTLRSIGDPNIRFREDPVRMIRAVRLAAKLGFTIDKASVKAIGSHAHEIGLASKPRLFDELLKIFKDNCSENAFRLAWSTGLLKHLLPGVAAHISDSGGKGSVFWDFLAAFDTYRKSNPDDKVLASSNAASLIPFATLLAPLYLSKHAKSQKRERLAQDLVAHNLVAQFSNKLFSQPQSIFRNIAFYLATLPEYRLGARVQRRDQRECLAIGRVFWEICATALGDSKALMFIKNADEPAADPDALPWEVPATSSTPAVPSPDPEPEEDDGLGLELKQPKGDSPLVRFIGMCAETQLEPVFRKLHETGELENLLPETNDLLKRGASPLFALLTALDARRGSKDLEKKNWRLVLPVAVIAVPDFAAAVARVIATSTSPENNTSETPDPCETGDASEIGDGQSCPPALPENVLETAANNAVSAIFAGLTRDKHTYSTIRKRAAQVLQTLYLPRIPQFWMSDIEMFRAIREICAEALPGYTPPADLPPRPHNPPLP
ncbi:MAG: hypothetical protein FWG05_02515 [Kiritimatiellaeota bacterium]|nr:hypothetical protein [Kiritimatiellota bacterium]